MARGYITVFLRTRTKMCSLHRAIYQNITQSVPEAAQECSVKLSLRRGVMCKIYLRGVEALW